MMILGDFSSRVKHFWRCPTVSPSALRMPSLSSRSTDPRLVRSAPTEKYFS